jgi:hypothetical protein
MALAQFVIMIAPQASNFPADLQLVARREVMRISQSRERSYQSNESNFPHSVKLRKFRKRHSTAVCLIQKRMPQQMA